MSGTLQKPYPKEKDPFHEDSTKPKSRIKRTLSRLSKSLRRSFRGKPEPQPANASEYNRIGLGHPKRFEPQEEFVIRSRIPDRCTAIQDTRHTVAAVSSTPVPPPRTSSILKRNRLNSTSSSTTTNPFDDDDVTPIFRENARTDSRHTLNIPQHGQGGMYGSINTLRTSCESICTVGGTRRKKRAAPQPPQNEIKFQDLNVTADFIEQIQGLQVDFDQSINKDSTIQNEQVNHDNQEPNLEANQEPTKDNNEDIPAVVDESEVIIPTDDVTTIKLEPNISPELENNEINGNIPIESNDPIEYVSSETIILKRNVLRRDSNKNAIELPVELTTFQPLRKSEDDEIDLDVELKQSLTLVQRRKARFESRMRGEDISDEDEELNHVHNGTEIDRDVKTDYVDVDINSNELPYLNVAVVREKLQNNEANMRYIDDDRDDILELEDSITNNKHLHD